MTRARATLGLLLLALVAGALRERAALGLEPLFFALAAALLGPLALHARAAPSAGASVLALAALSGLVTYPPGPWGHALAGLGLFLIIPSEDDARATPLEEAFPALVALPAIALLGRGRDVLGGVVLALVLAEAWGPGSPRGAVSALRRGGVLALLLGRGLLLGHWQEPWFLGADTLLLVLALLGVLQSLLLRRGIRSAAELARRARPIARRAAFALAPLFLFWVVLEGVFALLPNRHAEHDRAIAGSTWHVPGARHAFPPVDGRPWNVFTWNRDGYHDVDHELAKPRGRVRVVLTGDSFVSGVEVALEDALPRRLEPLLAKVTPQENTTEVLSFGQGGWGQTQELDALKSVAAPYRPDLVVLGFLFNDVWDDGPGLKAMRDAVTKLPFHRWQRRTGDLGLHFSAYLLGRLHQAQERWTGPFETVREDVYRPSPPRPELWQDAWARTEALFQAFQEETRRQGAGLVVVIFTTREEIERRREPPPGDVDHGLPARRVTELCRKRGIPVLDLVPLFQALPPEERAGLHLSEGHWSPLGHARAAEATARFLVESGVWRETLARAGRQ